VRLWPRTRCFGQTVQTVASSEYDRSQLGDLDEVPVLPHGGTPTPIDTGNQKIEAGATYGGSQRDRVDRGNVEPNYGL
jgi:hypothetical protein